MIKLDKKTQKLAVGIIAIVAGTFFIYFILTEQAAIISTWNDYTIDIQSPQSGQIYIVPADATSARVPVYVSFQFKYAPDEVVLDEVYTSLEIFETATGDRIFATSEVDITKTHDDGTTIVPEYKEYLYDGVFYGLGEYEVIFKIKLLRVGTIEYYDDQLDWTFKVITAQEAEVIKAKANGFPFLLAIIPLVLLVKKRKKDD